MSKDNLELKKKKIHYPVGKGKKFQRNRIITSPPVYFLNLDIYILDFLNYMTYKVFSFVFLIELELLYIKVNVSLCEMGGTSEIDHINFVPNSEKVLKCC